MQRDCRMGCVLFSCEIPPNRHKPSARTYLYSIITESCISLPWAPNNKFLRIGPPFRMSFVFDHLCGNFGDGLHINWLAQTPLVRTLGAEATVRKNGLLFSGLRIPICRSACGLTFVMYAVFGRGGLAGSTKCLKERVTAGDGITPDTHICPNIPSPGDTAFT